MSEAPSLETARIDRLGRQGDGIAETPSGPLFVPFTLPGELIELHRRDEKRGSGTVLEPSPARRAPPCRHFGRCGGCDLQHADEALYHDFKRGLVVEALQRARLNAKVEALVPCPPASRRRIVLTARRAGERLLVGFNEMHSHRIIAIEECPVTLPSIVEALPDLRRLAELLVSRRDPLRITITATDSGLDVACSGAGRVDERRRQRVIAFALQAGFARLTVDDEVWVVARPPSLRCGDVSVEIPPGSFVQAVASAEAAMARLAADHCAGAKRIADLFCGFGPFALRLASHSAVHAIEADDAALRALDAARRTHPGLKPVTVERRDLDRRPLPAKALNVYDAVVFDPPRAGAEAVARELAASKVKRVVAVSCNPVTLARDVSILIDGGFGIVSVTPIDQFLWSHHVEAVALLERSA